MKKTLSKKSTILRAEELVRRILRRTFNQKIDKDMLRATAKKVAQAIPAQ